MKRLSDVPESLEASVKIEYLPPDSDFGLTSPPLLCHHLLVFGLDLCWEFLLISCVTFKYIG